MKVKIALLVATLGSAALVASAQRPNPYVVTSARSSERSRRSRTPPVPVHEERARGPRRRRRPAARFSPAVPSNLHGGREGLSHQAEQLAQQLAAAKSDSDRDKIKSQLAEILEKQFDQRQKRHEEEIKQLEAQVKKLKDLVESGRRTAARSSAGASTRSSRNPRGWAGRFTNCVGTAVGVS